MNKQSIGEMLRKIDARPDELAEYKGKWRNLVVFKTGSHLGHGLYDSQEQAAATSVWVYGGERKTSMGLDGSVHRTSDFLFRMQIPVKS